MSWHLHLITIRFMEIDNFCIMLLQVMIQVASDALYLEIFQRFFRHRLLQLSIHPSANFVVQALIAAARHPGQVRSLPSPDAIC